MFPTRSLEAFAPVVAVQNVERDLPIYFVNERPAGFRIAEVGEHSQVANITLFPRGPSSCKVARLANPQRLEASGVSVLDQEAAAGLRLVFVRSGRLRSDNSPTPSSPPRLFR